MALLFIDSFDHYDTAHLMAKWTSRANPGFHTIEAGEGRCGTQALKMTTGGGVTLTKGIVFSGLTGIVGFAFRPGSQGFGEQQLMDIHSGGGSGDNLRLYRMIDGALEVRLASSPETVIGTTVPDVTRTDEWFYVEFRFVIDNAAGEVQVHVNGVEQLNVVGVDTVASNLGLTGFSFLATQSFDWFVDDLYVLDDAGPAPNNTFLGDVRVEYLRPEANGATQAWALVGALTHWEAVDDNAAPDDDTTYIHSATVGEIDTEVYENTGLPAGTIFGVQLDLFARKTDSGFREITPIVRHAGADYAGASLAPSFASYVYLMHVFGVNPGTGIAWTIADVNAAEYGVRVSV